MRNYFLYTETIDTGIIASILPAVGNQCDIQHRAIMALPSISTGSIVQNEPGTVPFNTSVP